MSSDLDHLDHDLERKRTRQRKFKRCGLAARDNRCELSCVRRSQTSVDDSASLKLFCALTPTSRCLWSPLCVSLYFGDQRWLADSFRRIFRCSSCRSDDYSSRTELSLRHHGTDDEEMRPRGVEEGRKSSKVTPVSCVSNGRSSPGTCGLCRTTRSQATALAQCYTAYAGPEEGGKGAEVKVVCLILCTCRSLQRRDSSYIASTLLRLKLHDLVADLIDPDLHSPTIICQR